MAPPEIVEEDLPLYSALNLAGDFLRSNRTIDVWSLIWFCPRSKLRLFGQDINSVETRVCHEHICYIIALVVTCYRGNIKLFPFYRTDHLTLHIQFIAPCYGWIDSCFL